MKKLILTLLFSIFFIPSVNASTNLDNPLDCFSIASPSSTKNIFSNNWGTSENACGYINGYFKHFSSDDTGSQYYCINNFIEIESETTYTFTHFDSSYLPIDSPRYNSFYIFDENFTKLSDFSNWFSPPYNYTTPANAKYLLYCTHTSFSSVPSNLNIQLELGPITSINDLSFEEYKEYIDEPVIPEEPIIADTTLDTFYSIYLSKLQSFSQYVIENKFLLGTIGIILLFVVLEIILNLFRKGGYR